MSVDYTRVSRPGAFLGDLTAEIRSRAATLLRGSEGLVVDVGCGNGLLFAEVGSPAGLRLVGLDGDPALLREAREIMADNRIEGARFLRGDAFHLPFREGSADLVLLLNTLVNIPTDRASEALLRGLMALCRPGGLLVFDFRDGANPCLRGRYLLHNLREDFVTRTHSLRGIRRFCEIQGFTVERADPVRRWSLTWAYLIQARRLGA